MADYHPELQARLDDLERELDEGDITQKGYDKRKAALLAQYFGTSTSTSELSPNRSIAGVPSSGHSSRQPSLGNILSNIDDAGPHALERPPSQVGRFQERQLGVRNHGQTRSISGSESLMPPQSDSASSYDGSRAPTMSRSEYAFNPADQPAHGYELSDGASQHQVDSARTGTMSDSQGGYFSDFNSQQTQGYSRDSYGGPQRYSMGEGLSNNMIPPPMPASSNIPSPTMISHQMPLEPRDIPFNIFDPHNSHIQMSKFDSIGAVLRHRGKANAKQPAYWVLDLKGKETAVITWEKLASKAEKVAQVIRDKSNLYRGDRVALVYRDTEIIDFAVALMGCFIAGVVAVPINFVDDYQKLNLLLTTTQAHLALTTDNNLKAFHRDITTNKLKWPTGVEWWKTNEFGSYHPRKKDESTPLQVPDLAYIEFSRAPTGDLRGVVLSHRTIMHQMACLSAILSTIPHKQSDDGYSGDPQAKSTIVGPPVSKRGETILTYLDPREGIGMILGVLLGVYGGHTTVWMESRTVETAGLYAHLITKYAASVMVADYSRLKFAAYNYQQDPMTTRNFKKGSDPNFSAVKICFIDTLTVDCEFHEILADRWFKPMRNTRARQVVAPILCLPEHGGMTISVRDWLGGEERMDCPLSPEESDEDVAEGDGDRTPDENIFNGFPGLTASSTTHSKKHVRKSRRTDLSEVLLDKEALRTNEVHVIAMGDEARRRAHEPGTVRVGAFGFPIPDATLAIVDPETCLLCPPSTVGEIWVDSPSLSGGFWSLPKHTETIFHARPFRFIEGSPTPVLVDLEFLRTGLLGCIIEGKVFVLGLYEDRIRQRVEWVEHGVQEIEHRYYFVQHLISTIMRNIPKIHDCSAFDVFVNGEYLPIVLIETLAASTAPLVPNGPPRQLDTVLLDSLCERCMDILYQEHHLRVYCVMVTAPNTLPKVVKNGRKEIGNMLCRKEFHNGSLPSVHVMFGVERAVQNLPMGDDPMGGIWSPYSTQARQELLMLQEKQYTGFDPRELVMDERTSTPLNKFSSICELLQWRVLRQAEELAYCTIDGRGREGKPLNWKKLDLKIAAVASYLKNKVKIQQGDHVLLMYTHSEEFVYAVHACFYLGAMVIPMAPVDSNRLGEDVPALLSMVADFRVKAILVNSDVDQLLKQKAVSQHLKQSASVSKLSLPPVYNTTKPPKQSHGCRELGLSIKPAWVQPSFPVLIWVYWTPDQRRVAVQLGHNNILALCKVQKETCNMTATRPILACVRSTIGLGFIHMALMGIYVAAPTYLVSPVDFAQNPLTLFLTLSRYKIKDTYTTSQMLDHAIASTPGKGFSLHEMRNLMISTDGRPRVDIYQKVRVHFAQAGLDRLAISTIYSHVVNPMITSRSYVSIEPIELWLDPQALRRGLVIPVDPDTEPFALLVQDSGIVPVDTRVAIVNPESNRLCNIGEYGEIWVHSDACGFSFYGSHDPLDAERFNGRTVDGYPEGRYVRTGDLGFLYDLSRPIGAKGEQIDLQALFVLGNIGETFDVNGLNHFPMDIENSVERCHRNIFPGGCAVFQAGGLVVVLVEVIRKNFLASIVPVIVNAILNGHQIIIDIVAFVARGDFPRSRLGEKQRGKILGSWLSRKMRTIAQFSIKNQYGSESAMTEVPGSRARSTSFRNSSVRGGGSSLKHVESSTTLAELEEKDYQAGAHAQPNSQSSEQFSDSSATLALRGSGYVSSSGGVTGGGGGIDDGSYTMMADNSPYRASQNSSVFELTGHGDNGYNTRPVSDSERYSYSGGIDDGRTGEAQGLAIRPGDSTARPPPQINTSFSNGAAHRTGGVGGGGGGGGGALGNGSIMERDEELTPQATTMHPPALRIANRTANDDLDDWPQEALMHMGLITTNPDPDDDEDEDEEAGHGGDQQQQQQRPVSTWREPEPHAR